MKEQQHKVVLFDGEGSPHEYIIRPHPASEGEPIMLILIEAVSEPLMAVLAQLITGPASLGEVLAHDLDDLAADINWAQAASTISGALRRANLTKLGPALLEYTTRDGSLLTTEDQKDEAYTRNYAEYLAALFEVIKYNRFLSLPSISPTPTVAPGIQ